MTTIQHEAIDIRLLDTALDGLRDLPDPAEKPGCRRVLRYAAALVPRELDRIEAARLLHAVAGDPGLGLDDVLLALDEEDSGESIEALRERADQVRVLGGADGVGLDDLGRNVAAWLGIVEDRADALAAHAAARVGGGWITAGSEGTLEGADPDAADVWHFAHRHGVSVGYAVKLMCRAAVSDAEVSRISAAGVKAAAWAAPSAAVVDW